MALRIMIVDDSMIVRKVLIKAIKLTDVPVAMLYEAANGREALEKLSVNQVDLIFLDINMPEMNGMEFMAKLRSMPEYSDISVIVVSTEGSKERREELFLLGITAFLRKPVTPEELTDALERAAEGL